MGISSNNDSQPPDLRRLLEENQAMLGRILENTEKSRQYILWGRVLLALKLLILLGLVIFATVTLPPLIERAIQPYKELLGSPDSTSSQGSIFEEVQGFLEEYNN